MRSQAGRTGEAARDLTCDYEDLLAAAHAGQGDARVCAERDLQEVEHEGLLEVERHRRTGKPQRVRFPAANEARLFAKLGLPSPAQQRQQLAAVFEQATEYASALPESRGHAWAAFCRDRAAAALSGASLHPLDRDNVDEIREILALLPRLLAWEGESMIRFASHELCRNSKRLEQLRSKLEASLGRIADFESPSVETPGSASSPRLPRTLSDLGITENERSCLLHGPLLMEFDTGTLDLGLFSAAVRVDRRDLQRARLRTAVARCLTVENAAVLHELCKLRTATIFASSGSEGGYANSATVAFLKRLPPEVECWHFGDSDPKGFDILRDLREKLAPAGRAIRSLHMRFRDDPASPPLTAPQINLVATLLRSPFLTDSEKHELRTMQAAGRTGDFEQESFGRPKINWPFWAQKNP